VSDGDGVLQGEVSMGVEGDFSFFQLDGAQLVLICYLPMTGELPLALGRLPEEGTNSLDLESVPDELCNCFGHDGLLPCGGAVCNPWLTVRKHNERAWNSRPPGLWSLSCGGRSGYLR
jgi:hypothetical protein